jgi:hypothetical protein
MRIIIPAGSDFSSIWPRNRYSHRVGIVIHITPERLFTCPGIRTEFKPSVLGWLSRWRKMPPENPLDGSVTELVDLSILQTYDLLEQAIWTIQRFSLPEMMTDWMALS